MTITGDLCLKCQKIHTSAVCPEPFSVPAVYKIVPDPKPCIFCVCDTAGVAKIAQSLRVCGCPCHWQNTLELNVKLEAVKYFFGELL